MTSNFSFFSQLLRRILILGISLFLWQESNFLPYGVHRKKSPKIHLFFTSFRSFYGNSTKIRMKIFNFLPLFLLFFRVFYDLASRQFHSKYLTKGAPKLGYSIQYFNNVIFYILYIHLSYIFSLFTTKTLRPASRRT